MDPGLSIWICSLEVNHSKDTLNTFEYSNLEMFEGWYGCNQSASQYLTLELVWFSIGTHNVLTRNKPWNNSPF